MTTRQIARNVNPLTSVDTKVARPAESGTFFLKTAYDAIQTTAPSGSEMRFAGGRIE